MFPDITRDDIFRLETRRLWLRWLRAADGAALVAICDAAQAVPITASMLPPLAPGEAERFILQARATTAAGAALVLAATLKNKPRAVIGVVSAQSSAAGEIEIGYLVSPQQSGQGYASEAAAALADAAFDLTPARALVARAHADNIASRHVLETCGFKPVAGAAATDLFRRERSDWTRSRMRRLPGMAHQSGRPER